MIEENPTDAGKPTVYTNGVAGSEELRRQLIAASASLRPGESLADFAARRPQIVREGVEKIIRRLQGVDAFDVLELLRNREIMAARMGYEEEATPASPQTLEIVGTALLSRGARTVGTAVRDDEGLQAMEMLHIVGARIGKVGTFSALADAEKAGDPWARLGANYRLTRLSIRNLHYRSIDDAINQRLFGQGAFAEELTKRLEFTWVDFQNVRNAIIDGYSTDLFDSFDRLASETRELYESEAVPTSEERERLRTLHASVMTHPGHRASFTAEEIARRSGVALQITDKILHLFSVRFIVRDPVEAVEAYLSGVSPFAGAALIRDDEGNYLQLGLEIGDDNYRQITERSLGRDVLQQMYNDHRREVTEATAGDYLSQILKVAPAAFAYYYYAEKQGFTASDLGPTAQKPTAVGKECEGDLLFLIDDVAICVEVKGASFSQQARSTRLDYFENEVKKTIGAGAQQARRVAKLIRTNGGLWKRDRTWLDLSNVREVRTIVVTLDDLGPLGSEIADLDAAGVMTRDDPSWIVSAYDLAIIADLIHDPSQFLLYLRRRTDPESAARWRVVDELDLVMLFFHTALEHQPKPARVTAEHPLAPAPGPDEQLLWDEQPTNSRVHDYTTAMLNPWYEYKQGDGPKAAKPELSVEPSNAVLVRAFSSSRMIGATVAAADLLGLTVAQRATLRSVVGKAQMAAASHRRWGENLSLAGSSGAGSIIVFSSPQGSDATDIEGQMRYEFKSVLSKWACDRALGIAIGSAGTPVMIGYISTTLKAQFVRIKIAPLPPSKRKRKNNNKKRKKR
tara:strand:+ start:7186 stop:9576 length:2391 start_codon:yes stop_codon:yes gene_type:complete